jgi:hypothetical protein
MSALPMTTIEDAIQAWLVAGSGLASDHVIWGGQGNPRPAGEFIEMRLTVLEHRGRDWLDRTDNVFTIPTLTISAVSTGGDTLTITGHGLATGDGGITFASSLTLPAPLLAGVKYWPVVIDPNTIKVAATFQNAVAAVPIIIDLQSAGSGVITIVATATAVHAGQEIAQKLRGPRRAMLTLECFAGAPTGGAATGTTSPTAVLHDAITSYATEVRSAALAAAGIGVGQIEPIRSVDGVVNSVRLELRAIGTVYLHLASELAETSTYIQVVNVTDNVPTPPLTLPPIVLP